MEGSGPNCSSSCSTAGAGPTDRARTAVQSCSIPRPPALRGSPGALLVSDSDKLFPHARVIHGELDSAAGVAVVCEGDGMVVCGVADSP